MNILIIDNSIAFTGAFKCAFRQAQLLSDQHRVIFLLPKNSVLTPELSARGFTVYTLPLREIRKSASALLAYPFFLVYNLWKLRKILRQEKIDYLQSNDFYNLLGVLAKGTGFQGRLLTWVRMLPSRTPAIMRHITIGLVKRYSYRVIAVSDAVLAELPKHDRIIRIYDPADFPEIRPARVPNQTITRFFYPGNFIPGKGQEYALYAFLQVWRKNNHIRLTFSGGDMGLTKNKKFLERLKKIVSDENLSDVVEFTSFRPDMEQAVKESDVVLNFSQSESFSMTCLEGSYYGVPVIATRCGGPEEIIVHGKTGFLVPLKNVTEMANAMLLLAEDPILRAKLGEAARIHTRKKFSTSGFQNKLRKILSA